MTVAQGAGVQSSGFFRQEPPSCSVAATGRSGCLFSRACLLKAIAFPGRPLIGMNLCFINSAGPRSGVMALSASESALAVTAELARTYLRHE
jgi:hypothetical protein